MEEIWKTLKYHDQVYNRYEVSTFGNIRHKINKINRKFYLDKKGYCRTSIFNGYVNNKRKIKKQELPLNKNHPPVPPDV